MPKKQQKKVVPTKKKTTKAIVSKPVTRKLAADPKVINYACALNDPFCEHAQQGRYADSGRVRSLPHYVHYSHAVGTDNNGIGAVLVAPNFQNYSTVNWASATSDNFTPLPFQSRTFSFTPAQVRLVTMGLTIKCVSAPLYRSGLVRIRVFDYHDGQRLGTVVTNTYRCSEYLDIPLADCHNVAINFRRISDIASLWQLPDHYATSGGAVNNWVSPGFQCLGVQIIGGPATTGIISLEVHEHWEMVMGDDDPLQELAQSPPPTSFISRTIAETVSNSSKSIFREGVKTAGTFIVDKAKKAMASFLGPVGTGVAMLVD